MPTVSKNKIKFKTSENLLGYKHGFFTKLGGVSKGIFNSLNCGYASSDKHENVKQNRFLVSQVLNFKIENLIVANQYHSNKVIVFKRNIKEYKCDAIINFDSNIALGVLTADCCPILVGHKKNIMTGSLHVGWKGMYSQIIDNFITEVLNNNIKTEDLIFGLGPSLNKDSFQVSESFYNNFCQKDRESENFFLFKNKKNGFYFDLKGYIKKKLNNLGVLNINSLNEDTYKCSHLYYSYRHSRHNGFNDYGRMLSVIVKN